MSPRGGCRHPYPACYGSPASTLFLLDDNGKSIAASLTEIFGLAFGNRFLLPTPPETPQSSRDALPDVYPESVVREVSCPYPECL